MRSKVATAIALLLLACPMLWLMISRVSEVTQAPSGGFAGYITQHPACLPLTGTARQERLQLLAEVRRTRTAEANASFHQLDTIVIFYLSFVIGGIVSGLFIARRPINFEEFRQRPATTPLVLAFVAFNAAFLLYAAAQLANGMANAQFVAVYVDPDIEQLAGPPSEAFEWYRWYGTTSKVGLGLRDLTAAFWVVLVTALSMASLLLSNIPAWAITRPRKVGLAVFLAMLAIRLFTFIHAQSIEIQVNAHFRELDKVSISSWSLLLSIAMTAALIWIGTQCAQLGADSNRRTPNDVPL
jgi:hypothetical protein